MNIGWTSRQGRQRRRNSDAAAVGYTQQYLIVMVVDAAEKSSHGRCIAGVNAKGQRLASYWADSCVTEFLATGAYRSEEALIHLLHQQQLMLKQDYLHDIASYGVLVMDTAKKDFQWWYTGDCRLGLQDKKGEFNWLSPPHRLASLPLLQGRYESPADAMSQAEQLAARHTLSQSLNARRFKQPERVAATLPAGESIGIATDGYWCEHLGHSVPLEALVDDASLLTISSGRRALSLQTDAPNLLITYGK